MNTSEQPSELLSANDALQLTAQYMDPLKTVFQAIARAAKSGKTGTTVIVSPENVRNVECALHSLGYKACHDNQGGQTERISSTIFINWS